MPDDAMARGASYDNVLLDAGPSGFRAVTDTIARDLLDRLAADTAVAPVPSR